MVGGWREADDKVKTEEKYRRVNLYTEADLFRTFKPSGGDVKTFLL